MIRYNDVVKDHFTNPRNLGDMDKPDGMAEVVSMACGDIMRLMFKVDGQGRIADVRCRVAGCVSSIAAASALTELIKGKSIKEALEIDEGDIVAYLGGLPPGKTHGPAMGREVLEAAVEAYTGLQVAHKKP